MDVIKIRGSMNSMAIVRTDDVSKVKIALYNLVRYANLTFSDKARKLEPTFADNILTHIMKSQLKACCSYASIVPLEDQAGVAIGRFKKIHPPAHVIIVSPRHEIYHELVNYVRIYYILARIIKDSCAYIKVGREGNENSVWDPFP